MTVVRITSSLINGQHIGRTPDRVWVTNEHWAVRKDFIKAGGLTTLHIIVAAPSLVGYTPCRVSDLQLMDCFPLVAKRNGRERVVTFIQTCYTPLFRLGQVLVKGATDSIVVARNQEVRAVVMPKLVLHKDFELVRDALGGQW